MIDVYIHGAAIVFYSLPIRVRLSGRSRGSILYGIIKDFCNIPVELQLLLHTGKAVQQECTPTSQGITHGTTIYFCVKGIGGVVMITTEFF